MAFASLALRLATVYALRGRTVAGERVTDSEISAVDMRAKENRQPALVVYTDDFAADQLDGRDLLTGERSLQLAIEILVADQVEHEGGVDVTVPETDAGLELSLDLLQRQVIWILQGDAGPWSEIWRQLVLRIRKAEGQRGAGSKESVRFAARQLVLTVQPLAEPPFGAPAEGVWRSFLDLVALEPDIAPLAPLMEQALLGEPLTDWRRIQALLGLTLDGVRGIGVAPVFEADPGEEAPPVAQVAIDGDDGERVIEPEVEP